MSDRFRVATRDELRLRGRVLESRLAHGTATFDEHGILADDARDDELVAMCDRELERLRAAAAPIDARVRLVADARVENGELSASATLTIALEGMSVVTTPEHVLEDYELLRSIAFVSPDAPFAGYGGISLVWRNGAASVLLHEAVGHAAEHEGGGDAARSAGETPALRAQRNAAVPAAEQAASPPPRPWLNVEAPLLMRRATFRDVPLLRMTTLIVRQTNAPFELPRRRIEVLLVAGGAYEPLTETVTLRIAAADLIDGQKKNRLPPFTIVETRDAIARAVIGAEGEPQRYPGVVCSREGQELVVGSHAPVMVTDFR